MTTREEVQQLLKSGLQTEVFPRAYDHDTVQEIVHRLQTSDRSVRSKLVIAGFTLKAIEHDDIEQSCETCMYYLVHRKHCELPEIDLPVEPEWSCRVWRI